MAENQAQEPVKMYKGNCHCGAFVYELNIPEIKTGNACNCSICSKKGYLWLFPPRDAFTVTKGSEDDLTTYTFAEGKLHHKFCPHCGTAVMATMPGGPPNFNFGLNARAIQGLNSLSLEPNLIDGAALGDPYKAPTYSGPQPSLEIEGGKVYHGNCHCGAVQVALASKPIDSTYSGKMGDCNCSVCERNAYIWVYPLRDQVVLHGDPNDIGRYFFNSKLAGKTFCKKCGVQMTNEPIVLTEEGVAALSEHHQKVYEIIKTVRPVNLRVLEGLDLGALKDQLEHMNGADRPPKYEIS